MNSPFDLLRRSFENTVANWPLVLMRLAEVVILITLIVLAVVVTVVPLAFAGMSLAEEPYGDTPEEFLRWLSASWPMFAVIVVVATIVGILIIAVHSFAQAATVGVLLEGDRAAGPDARAPRPSFKVFQAERFLEYGRKHWWVTFLIYNIVWGVAGIVMLVPVVPFALAAWYWRATEAVFVAGCLGVAVTVAVIFVAGFVAWVISNIAIVAAVARDLSATTAIGESWRILKAAVIDVLVAVVGLQAISMAVAMMFVMMHMSVGAFSMIPFAGLITLPFQIGASVVQNALSIFIGIWMTAAFASIIVREHINRESAVIR